MVKIENSAARYFIRILILTGATIIVALLIMGAWLDLPGLNWLALAFDQPPHHSPVFLSVVGLMILAWGVLLYGLYLTSGYLKRSRVLVFINVWVVASYFAFATIVWFLRDEEGVVLIGLIMAPVAAVLPAMVLLIAEGFLVKILSRMARLAQRNGWRLLELRMLGLALRWNPENQEIHERIGLLYAATDEFGRAIESLLKLGPIDNSERPAVIRALEESYRAFGQREKALACLLRLQALEPETAGLSERILQDYLSVGRYQDSLDLLESGKIEEDEGHLMLRQELNMRLGNFAQALNLTRRIKAKDTPPYSLSIGLYEDMLKKFPDNLDIKIDLGELLLSEPTPKRASEGAALLEKALAEDPRRRHLSRHLARYYHLTRQTKRLYPHLKQLVESGDSDVEFYLTYADLLTNDGRDAEAIDVLKLMSDLAPDDWRAYRQLTREYVKQGDPAQAELAFARAEALVPVDAGAAIGRLREDVERLRREKLVNTFEENVENNREDVSKRLEMIRNMIDIGRLDKAFDECDQLLEEHPELTGRVEVQIKDGIERIEKNFKLRDYLGDLYFKQGRYEEMLALCVEMAGQSLNPARIIIEACRKILSRDNGHVAARKALARACHEEKNWQGVTEALDPLIEIEDVALDYDDMVLRFEAAFRLGCIEEAAQIGLKLADTIADYTDFMLMLIEVLQDRGDYEAVMEVYHKARAATPDELRLVKMEKKIMINSQHHRLQVLEGVKAEGALSAEDHLEKADLHQALGQSEDAIIHYQRASEDDGLYEIAMVKMAVTLCERGMYDLAEETLEPIELNRALVKRFPQIKDHFYDVARNMERIKRLDLAGKYYKRLFRVDASFRDLVTRLARFT